jgi:cullin-associated NEDD8-dissociated protein 1
LAEYLPFILHEIETQPRRKYLLFHSLKEVISAQSVSPSGAKLNASLNFSSALMRTTMVTVMKITISDQPQPIDQLLMAEIGHCLTTLKDPDLNVRRVALVDFNSAAHNKPSLIRVLLRDVVALQ